MRRLRRLATQAGLIAALLPALPAAADAQISFYGTGGDVFVKYMGCDASFTSDLRAGFSVGGSAQQLFTCHVSSVGSVVNIGHVALGTEVIFSLFVRNTGWTFYSGPASRNPDGQVHVQGSSITGDGVFNYQFGFEDLYGGGDRDYNDNLFRVGGVTDVNPVPEPATIMLMATGFAGLAGAARRRRQKQSA